MHFSSRKVRGEDRSLLELLQAATVHVSHHISKSLLLMQGPSVYNVDNLEANFHMDVIDGRLMLYVPAEKQKMEACYLEELPKHVFNFFEISNQAAEAVLIKIIGSSSFEMVDNILEKAGIVEVQGVGRPVDGDISGARLGTDSVLDAQTQQPPDHGNRARSILRQNSSAHMHANDVDLTYSQPNGADPIIDMLSARQRTMSTHSPDPQIIESIEQPVEHTAYATLLERLIRTARNAYLPLSDTPSHCFCSRTSTLPTFNCADHHTTYPSIFNFRSLDRDRKVGAAGELFVSDPRPPLPPPSPTTNAQPPLPPGLRNPQPPQPPPLQRHHQLAQHAPQRSARERRPRRARAVARRRDVRHRVPRRGGRADSGAAGERVFRRGCCRRAADVLHRGEDDDEGVRGAAVYERGAVCTGELFLLGLVLREWGRANVVGVTDAEDGAHAGDAGGGGVCFGEGV